MATFEQRLQALESKNAINKDNVTDIILVEFVGADDVDSPFNHLWHGVDHFYKADGETEDDFKSRASVEIRKNSKAEPNSMFLLFGDKAIENISN